MGVQSSTLGRVWNIHLQTGGIRTNLTSNQSYHLSLLTVCNLHRESFPISDDGREIFLDHWLNFNFVIHFLHGVCLGDLDKVAHDTEKDC